MRKILLFCTLLCVSSLTSFKAQEDISKPKITDALGNENPVIDCNYPLNGNCLNLNVTYPKFFETTSYKVESEVYKPYGKFNSGIPLNANADDLFIKKIVIPFNFCFFGISYNEVVISSNGIITFNSNQLGNVSYPNIEASNPSPALPLNSIFGVAQDLVFSDKDDSEIYYSVIDDNSCKKLVINFYKGRVVGCDQTVTSQIVLSECSNEIEVFVDEKPLSCDKSKFKETLIGIINADGTLGYSPPERNTGVWTAEKEAWKFTANGNEVVPTVSWYNSQNENIGNGDSVKVCPEKSEKYTAKVSYSICGKNNLILEDDASVTFAADFPLVNNFTKVLCGSAPLDVNLNDYLNALTPQNTAGLIFSFHITLDDAQNNVNPQPKNFSLQGNKTFYVRIQNPGDANCFRTSILKLNLISKSLLTSDVEICDVNNDGVEKNYTLSLLNPKLFDLPVSGTIHYFKSEADANSNTGEVVSADIINNSVFFIRYEALDCNHVFGPIKVTFLPSPAVNTPIDYQYKTCDLKNDHVEPFSFLLVLGPLITNDPNVVITFYNTYNEAFSGMGSQINTVHEGKYQIFARVEIPGGCFSIATINLDITFTKVEAKDKTVYECFDGTEDVSVNLDSYSADMLINPLVNIDKGYFLTINDAEANVNTVSNMQTITNNGNFVSKIYYVRFTDPTGCYALKELKINLVHVIIANSTFDVCDFNNDGSEVINLSNYSSQIVGSQTATVQYYVNESDAKSGSNPITKFQFTSSGSLFVKISSFNCSGIFPISFNLTPTPTINKEVNVIRNSVCDNNNDNEENFNLTEIQSKIYNGTSGVAYSFYTAYDAANNSVSGLISTPESFSVKGISTVYAKVSFTSGGCYSVSKINIKLNFLPAVILKSAKLAMCDYEFNLNESFILSDAVPQIFIQAENSMSLSDIDISYYETSADANLGDPAKQIKSSYVTNDSERTVWARFSSKTTLCYSIAPILLKTYLPPKAFRSTINDICDDNLDGSYEVNLLDFTGNMVNQNSADNIFTFYRTEDDANTKINAIANPENFKGNPLPARIWVRIENIPGCDDVASVDLKLGIKVPLDNAGPLTVTNTCDTGNDGKENIDLTQFQNTIYSKTASFEYFTSIADLNNYSNKIAAPNAYPFNENAGPKKIYVKVSAPGFCPDIVVINLTLKKTPMFSLQDYYFCPEGFIDIQPDFSDLNIASFEWIDPTGKVISTNDEILNVKTEGTYKINVIAKNGCSFSTQFQVKKYEVPNIKDLVADGNTIKVIATGSKAILYSKDGITYQLSNVFADLPAGVTTFYVKFVDSDCLGPRKQGLILNIRNAFSPNGDGTNDTWYIDDLYVFDGKTANIKIYDRYQKKIYEQDSSTKLEWNGKITGGRAIPTDSYWYVLTLPDGRAFDGWIVLKNRN